MLTSHIRNDVLAIMTTLVIMGWFFETKPLSDEISLEKLRVDAVIVTFTNGVFLQGD